MAKKSAFEDTVETAAPPPPDPVPEVAPVFAEATYTPPPAPPPPPDVTRDRIVDLCRHAVRTDPGGTGRLAAQILADLGV